MDEELEIARRGLLQQLREYIGGSEAWPDQFANLADAIEALIDVKIRAAVQPTGDE